MLSLGHIGNSVSDVLKEIDNSKKIGHYNIRFVKPLDENMLEIILNEYEHIITIEDGSKIGGMGSAVLEFANRLGSNKKIKIFGIDDTFIEHGTVEELQALCHIDVLSLKNYINELY